ncbi:MAG TPA: hypothetical protein VGO96_19970 [Pyrinomonadaceae bacterium]|jgi:hypothetical protein|nr:hypothetical protein [Pyrinomonadaceae bacterium]
MRKTSVLVSAVAAFALVVAFSVFAAQEKRDGREEALKHSEWVAKSLKEMQTVKVGATRADLLRVFGEEGGLSTRVQRTYAYRECPYIKVDVEFRPFGDAGQRHDEHPNDEIIKISRPYLDWSVAD